MFKGSLVALITPFKNGQVDKEKLRELVDFHLENGTQGIVPCGCTGEAFTLNFEERGQIIETVVEEVRGRIPVVPGTGSSSTQVALGLTREAKKRGAHGALIITPFGNKPNPEGVYNHYAQIAGEVKLPIILYNVPSRTGMSIPPEVVARLSKISNIVGIKEASGSLDQVTRILNLCDITVLSGDDSLTLPMLAIGAKGVVSTVANLVPQDMAELVIAFFQGDLEGARRLHFKLFPLIKALFLEGNPIPLKGAMRLVGMLNGELRPPLAPLSEGNLNTLKGVMRDYGLIGR